MKMSENGHRELLDNGMPKTNRFITDHNSKGEAIFNTSIDEAQPWEVIVPEKATFALNYTTSQVPVSFEKNKDIAQYQEYLDKKPGLSIKGGSVVRVVDMCPAHVSPMHRTVSLDYGVVLEGEVYLVLDSGEERLMKRGDISVQRGTNHAWRNASSTSWARMMYVLLESEPIQVDGKKFGEDLGDMENVRNSS